MRSPLLVVALLLACALAADNYALIIDTSRTWRNYRHAANVMKIYEQVTRLGIPSSNVVLMVGDDSDCDARNSRPATLVTDAMYFDYRCQGANLDSFVRVLLSSTGNKDGQLQSHKDSNLLLYISGHGGTDFLKFLDQNELTNQMLADLIDEMWAQNRYKNLLIVVDSCKSSTMFSRIKAPNVIAVSSSGAVEDSISAGLDYQTGCHQADRFTLALAQFLATLDRGTQTTLGDVFDVCPYRRCLSTVTPWSNLDVNSSEEAIRIARQMRLIDFFGSPKALLVKRRTLSHVDDYVYL